MNLEEDEGARLEVRLRYLVQTHPRLLVALVPLLCKPRLSLAIATSASVQNRHGDSFTMVQDSARGSSLGEFTVEYAVE